MYPTRQIYHILYKIHENVNNKFGKYFIYPNIYDDKIYY